jgi:hypothetical protein
MAVLACLGVLSHQHALFIRVSRVRALYSFRERLPQIIMALWLQAVNAGISIQ